MKKSILIALAGLFLSQPLPAKTAAPKELNVLSFNIKRNGDLQEKAVKIAADMNTWRQYKPQFILLQEVKGENDATSPEKIMASRLGGYYSNFSSKTGSKEGEGSAIISKYPFLYYDYLVFSPNRPLKRIAIMGEFLVPDIGLVRVVNVHLSWQPALEGSREDQIEMTLQWLKEREARKHAALTFFGGDFNLHPDSSDLRKVVADRETSFIDINDPKADTRSSKRVDYIFASAADTYLLQGRAELLYKNEVSDHKGVLHRYRVTDTLASLNPIQVRNNQKSTGLRPNIQSPIVTQKSQTSPST